MDISFDDFMEEYSQKFVQTIQETLREPYKFAPGFFGNAYSNGRNPRYQGSASKEALGGLINSVSAVYKGNGVVEIMMAEYWRYVDRGRKPGKEITRTRKSKTGKQFQVKDWEGRPPTSALLPWIQKRFGLSGDDAQSAAFAIATNIARFGIQKTDFFDRASIKLEDQIAENFPQEADDLIGDFFDNQIFKNV
jgi:hypothetical protein